MANYSLDNFLVISLKKTKRNAMFSILKYMQSFHLELKKLKT